LLQSATTNATLTVSFYLSYPELFRAVPRTSTENQHKEVFYSEATDNEGTHTTSNGKT